MNFETVLYSTAFLALAVISWPSDRPTDAAQRISEVEALYTTPAPALRELTIEDLNAALNA